MKREREGVCVHHTLPLPLLCYFPCVCLFILFWERMGLNAPFLIHLVIHSVTFFPFSLNFLAVFNATTKLPHFIFYVSFYASENICGWKKKEQQGSRSFSWSCARVKMAENGLADK